jgi:hypothetical protein
LRVEVLQNDPDFPPTKLGGKAPTPPDPELNGISVIAHVDSVKLGLKEHPSQHYFTTWKEEGESMSSVLDEKLKLRIKFGVLKVQNLKRGVWKGAFHAGNATDLKADVSLVTDTGEELTQPQNLDWYRVDWDLPFRGSDKLRESLTRLKAVAAAPSTNLPQYLRNEAIDLLLVGREAYLLLFYSYDSPQIIYLDKAKKDGFKLSGSAGAGIMTPFGRYKVRVTIYCKETTLKELSYDVRVSDWNDFTITQVGD